MCSGDGLPDMTVVAGPGISAAEVLFSFVRNYSLSGSSVVYTVSLQYLTARAVWVEEKNFPLFEKS